METIANNEPSAAQTFSRAMIDSPRCWNPEKALVRVDGDRTLLRELIQLFIEDYPQTIQQLRLAISQGDARSLERHAHTLKGSAGNFEAAPVVTAGLELETSGFRRDLTYVPQQMENLEAALAQLRCELEAFLLA